MAINIKKIGYSESQKINTGKFETRTLSFSVEAEATDEGENSTKAIEELVEFVRETLNSEVKKLKNSINPQ